MKIDYSTLFLLIFALSSCSQNDCTDDIPIVNSNLMAKYGDIFFCLNLQYKWDDISYFVQPNLSKSAKTGDLSDPHLSENGGNLSENDPIDCNFDKDSTILGIYITKGFDFGKMLREAKKEKDDLL